MPVPMPVQHVSSAASKFASGAPNGNNFTFNLPNPVLAGNCLILGITYPNGLTVTSISDSVNGTWPAAAVTAVNSGNLNNAIYVLPNAGAGLTRFTIVFSSATIQFQYTVSEFNNIATASPVNNQTSNPIVTGPNLTCGSFTPANNNANGGNLIWAYFALSGTPAGGNPSIFSPTGGFTLLDGNIAYGGGGNFGLPTASEFFVQTTSAAINPGITATGDSADTYNCVAVALTVASAGQARPAGIHVDRLLHFTLGGNAGSSTYPIQIPSSGNFRLLMFANYQSTMNITSVVDSEGNTWTKVAPTTDTPQTFYWQGGAANNALTATATVSGAAPVNSVRYFDVSGALSSGAVDATANTGFTGTSSGSVANQPNITPTVSGDLVVATCQLVTGPGFAVTSPAGAIWNQVTYTGETDADQMENADCVGHVYNAPASLLNWTWTITNNGTNVSAAAIAIKAAPISQPPPSVAAGMFQLEF